MTDLMRFRTTLQDWMIATVRLFHKTRGSSSDRWRGRIVSDPRLQKSRERIGTTFTLLQIRAEIGLRVRFR